jgi:hypothetical protein
MAMPQTPTNPMFNQNSVTIDGQSVLPTLLATAPVVITKSPTSAQISWQPLVASNVRVMQVDNTFRQPVVSWVASTSGGTITNLIPNTIYRVVIIVGDSANVPYSYPGPDAAGNFQFYAFKTPAIDATLPTNFVVYRAGPPSVYQGSVATAFAEGYLTQGPSQTDGSVGLTFRGGMWVEDTNVTITPPQGTVLTVKPSVHWVCGLYETILDAKSQRHVCNAGLQGWWASTVPTLNISIPSNMPPGQYIVSAPIRNYMGPTATRYFVYPLVVKAVPAPKPRLATIPPPVPNLDNFTTIMRNSGVRYCNPTERMDFGYESEVWFYDGTRNFLQLSDYLNDNNPIWFACAKNIADQYVAYINSNSGNLPGWRVFGQGLAMMYWRTGDTRYKDALGLMANGMKYFLFRLGYEREAALNLSAYVMSARVGNPIDPALLQQGIDTVLNNLTMVQVSGVFDQPFFDGLSWSALVDAYEYLADQGTPDPRIPPALKDSMDYMYNVAVVKSGTFGVGAAAYDVIYHNLWPSIEVPNTLGEYYTALNNLFASTYSWYYNLTGDSESLARADFLFQHSLDQENLNYGFVSGKQFSDNAKESYNFIHWRQATDVVHSLATQQYNPAMH